MKLRKTVIDDNLNAQVETCRIEHPTGRDNFAIVHYHNRKIAFSYETPIGYASASTDWAWKVRVNDWGTTTGKHMNYLGQEAGDRIPAWRFLQIIENDASQVRG